MKFLGYEITRKSAHAPVGLSPPLASGAGQFAQWFPFLIREANPGDWQRNIIHSLEILLANPIVYACISLIAADIGKLRPRLMAEDEKHPDVYAETTSPAFSPVLARPNSYQNRIEFFMQWVISELSFGNTFVIKERDNRQVVTALHILNPRRVLPLVAADGSIYYQLSSDNIANLPAEVVVPASELIHDKINCLFHPLVGVSPIFGCGLPATTGLEILRNSSRFFKSGANPSGVLTIPGALNQDKADAIKTNWATKFTGDNSGAVAVLADGAKFEPMTMTSVDSELVNQLKMTNEEICSCFHVPGYMVGVGPLPTNNNIEALAQQYLSQCLDVLIGKIELCLTEGLGMTASKTVTYSVCMDLSQLLRMDTAARYQANSEAIKGGWMTPNEARQVENLEPVEGGDTCYLQQQNFSLHALAKRDDLPNPFVIDRPTTNPTPSGEGPPVVADPHPNPDVPPPDQQAAKAEVDLFLRSVLVRTKEILQESSDA